MERIIRKLTHGWMFHQGEVVERRFPDYGEDEWEPITIPHTWNDKDTFIFSRGYYRGVGWYKCCLEIEEELMDHTLLLEFDAAFGYAEVWINEVYKGCFPSGYTGCVIDISRDVRPGPNNLIAVRTDNRHRTDVLPGREEPDYNLYGGIYREVRLIALNQTHIDWRGVGIRVKDIQENQALIEVEADIVNTNRMVCSLYTRILDMDGKEIIASICSAVDHRRFSGIVSIPNARLWCPDDPYLYRAKLTLMDNKKNSLDETEVSFGVRTYRFDSRKGFFLNGMPLKLNGVNRHQCYPGLGNAVPESLQWEDARLIKEMGGNFVRASHYPQHPAFLDACDCLGILVYEEIATWQTIGNEAFRRSAALMMKEMIKRDRNHPSIIIWGMMNEGRSREMFYELHQIAKEMDPDRITAYAENKFQEGKKLGTVTIPDVLGINYQLQELDSFHDQYPNYCMLVAEYANSCTTRQDDEGMKKQLRRIAGDLSIIEESDYIAGGALWSMHDYGSDYEFAWPVQHSGIFDMYRIPKYAYYYLVSRWRKEPMIFIAGHWTYPGQEGQAKQVMIITNCQDVELFLNGESVGKKDIGGILIFDVTYEPGELKAVGVEGTKQVEYCTATAGQPTHIQLGISPARIPANGSETALITAAVTDEKGVVVPDANMKVSLQMNKQIGKLCGLAGENFIYMQAGIGRMVFKAGFETGTAVIRAEGNGIRSDDCVIELIDESGTISSVVSTK